MTSEDEYRQVVDTAVENRTDMPISNGRPEHAVYLIQKLLENATEVVRIFSGTLARSLDGVPAYGNERILAAARGFLDKGGTMKVLLEKPIDVDEGRHWTEHPLVTMARSRRAGDLLEVKQAPKDGLDELREANVLYHWITMDDQAYRLEMDTRQARAIANFGNSKTARALVAIFDDLFSKAKPLSESQYV